MWVTYARAWVGQSPAVHTPGLLARPPALSVSSLSSDWPDPHTSLGVEFPSSPQDPAATASLSFLLRTQRITPVLSPRAPCAARNRPSATLRLATSLPLQFTHHAPAGVVLSVIPGWPAPSTRGPQVQPFLARSTPQKPPPPCIIFP